MGSTIRGIRDQRFSVRTGRETRDVTFQGEPTQKTYDADFTAHSSNVIPPAFSGEPSRTDAKIDHANAILKEQAKRIQTMTANAILTDRREFYYYKRKRTGRRCSCYLTETSPENQCPICLGVGVVGGFEKHGTITEILDFTSPGVVMVNVEPNLTSDTRPVYMQLQDGASYGFVEAELPLRANIGQIDTYMLYQPIFNRGTSVIATNPNGFSAEIKKCEDLVPFLSFNKVKIKIEFKKLDDRPIISHFMLRYKIAYELKIFGDVERSQENLVGSQFGVFDTFQEINVAFDGKTIKNFENEDLLYKLEDGKRLKITTVNDNFFASTLTSTDCKVRYLLKDIDVGEFNLLL